MEYIVEKTNKVKKLSDDEKTTIALKIVDNFKTYNDSRQSNIEKANVLINELFYKFKNKYDDEEDNWKSDVHLCKLYMLAQTLKAFIWKNSYSGINSMFDVSGENMEADSDSNKQKAMLVDKLDKMNFVKTSDEVINHSLIHGELISYTTWKKKTEEYRRPITFFETMFQQDVSKLPKIIDAKMKGKNFYIDERVIYDDAQVIAVDPFDFVFDVSQKSDFDNAPKILRTWRTPDDICNNKEYEISNEVKKIIRNLPDKEPTTTDLSNQTSVRSESNFNTHINGSTVEVLEHYGNFILPDGTILKNWYAVVVGGKYLVKFEKNPLVINPFTFATIIEDADTCRGISVIYSAYSLAKLQETLMNKTVDMQSLAENPPVYSPKEFFDEDDYKIKLFPGKVIEYDHNLYGSVPVEKMQFNPTVFQNDISYIDELISEITGIFPNMAGAGEAERTTATEINVRNQSQNTRLNMILDTISQNFIVAAVEKVAKLYANFKFGEENIYLNKDNNPENVLITDKIRQADYRYTYSDRSAMSDRFNYADMLIMAVERFAKFLPLNAKDLFIYYMEQKGVENPERFIQQVEQIPPEIQQELMKIPQVQAMIQGFNARKQEEESKNPELKPNIPNQPFTEI